MWCEAGFAPDSFWHQTPAHFQACMTGVRKRLETETRERFRQSYETAALMPVAQAGKLKPMQHYLRDEQQSPRAMLAALKALQASGALMNIKRVKREV